MKLLDCVFTASVFVTLKRVLETVIEGTERARFLFRPQSETPMVIEAVDSLWACRTRAAFKRHCFERVRLQAPVELTVDIKVMHDFLRGCKQSKRLKLSLETAQPFAGDVFVPPPRPATDGQLVLADAAGAVPPVTLYHCTDDNAPPFADVPYQGWPSFHIHSQELTNIALDLAVGGTEMTVTVHPNRDICLASVFDTGSIEHYGHHSNDHSVFQVVTAPAATVTSGRCIVKFLKLVCALAVMTPRARVFVQAHGSVVVALGAHEHLECVCVIRPYKGPRDVVVPEPYLSYALRVT